MTQRLGAGFQRLIPTGEQSGLQTHIATTESGSLCTQMKADCVSGTGIGNCGRLRQRHGLIVKGKRISCPPHYAPPNNDYDPPHHDYEHGFPLIRSLQASAQRSTSVLFSFVLSLLIMAGSFTTRQSKTILARFCEAHRGSISGCQTWRP